MNQKYRFFPNAATGFLSDEDTKKYFSRIGFAVFGFFVTASLSSAGLALLYAEFAKMFYPTLVSNTSYWMIAANIISLISSYCIALPIFLVISGPLPKITPYKTKMGIKGLISGFFIALLFLSIGNYISNVILISIESMMNITTTNPVGEMVENSDVWITVVFAVILGPILEEIVFRKIVCDRLLPLGEGYAVFVSAAIFALIHGNLYQFAYAFLNGIFFAFIYVKTGKLIYSTIYHIFVNFVGSVVTLWLSNIVDLEAINGALESGVIDTNNPALMQSVYILFAYEAVMLACYVIGLVIIFKAKKKNLVRLETGIIPPPKQHRFSNIFLTSGVAASIAIFVFTFVFSLL